MDKPTHEWTMRNVRTIHECALKPDSQYTKKPLDYFVGNVIKMAFQSADSGVEHIWVKVSGIKDDALVGTLDNDPVEITHLKFGDEVSFYRTMIEDFRELNKHG